MTEDPDKTLSGDAPDAEPVSEAQASASDPGATPVAASDEGVQPETVEEAEADGSETSETPAEEPEPTVPAGEPEAPVAPPAPAKGSSAAPKAPARRRARSRGGEKTAPEPPAAPASRRARPRRDPDAPRPVVRAQAKFVRSSARKARLVCDNIRGKSVEEARAILAVTPRAVARDWSKLLESAVANAEHNHELVGEDLYVKAVHADEGPTIKRFRPRAMGRATKIRKRTAHLTILLTPKD
jgi:ribosomal protein L22